MCLNYYYTAKVNGRQRTIWWAAQIRKRNKSWILSCPTENKSQLANVLAMKVGVVRPVWELNALENDNFHFIWLDVCPKTQTQAPLGTKMFMQLDSIFRSQSKQLNDVSQTHTHTHMETRSLRISRFVCLTRTHVYICVAVVCECGCACVWWHSIGIFNVYKWLRVGWKVIAS